MCVTLLHCLQWPVTYNRSVRGGSSHFFHGNNIYHDVVGARDGVEGNTRARSPGSEFQRRSEFKM